MKKTVIGMTMLIIALTSQSQTIQGSIEQGATPDKVNILYKPDHNSTVGEYVNYLSISVAVPLSVASGVSPTIAGVGNFASLSFTQAVPFSYTFGTDKIYSWICSNGTPLTMSWTTGTAFTGATITFAGGNASSKVRLVDLTNAGGGDNANSFFAVGVNISPFDLTNYADMFYTNAGGNGSTESSYGNGDFFVETNALVVLPVNLIGFSGYKEGNKNTLHWTTVTEVNNVGFEVQRSIDGVNYSGIGFVNSLASSGNSSSSLRYSFDDYYPVGRRQYYRLKQVDIDDRNKLSNIVLITGEKPFTIAIGGIFPNPAMTSVNLIIDAPKSDRITLSVTDISGRLITQKKTSVETGSNTIPLDISQLGSGNYMVMAVDQAGDKTTAVKFIKQ
jgi:hypothetical protein